MDLTARTRPFAWIGLHAALALGWVAFARWAVAPMLAAEHPGPLAEALMRYLHVPPVAFLRQDPVGQWGELSSAVLMAIAIHLAIVVSLGRTRRAIPDGGASRSLDVILSLIAAAFLAVAVLAPKRQDYYFYLEIWYQVRQGNDPWFLVWGSNGHTPLNAYGPLFNLLAFLAWLNPVAPRLLLTSIYLAFAIALCRGFAADRAPSAIRNLGLFALIALLWNPFAWVEIPFYGHFDVLVGLACLGAVRARARGWEVRSALALAAGVLLKYLPIVLVPFLALDHDRRRPRARFLAVALGTVAVGLGVSQLVWGPSTFAPLTLAATRSSAGVSLFSYLRTQPSPFMSLGFGPNYDFLSTPALLASLGGVWWWYRARKVDLDSTILIAALVVVLLYRVGYPQYQMVPFVLGVAWLVGGRDRPGDRIAPAIALALYFGWIAVCDVVYMLDEAWRVDLGWHRLQDMAGLPAFLLGCGVVACVARSSMLATRAPMPTEAAAVDPA